MLKDLTEPLIIEAHENANIKLDPNDIVIQKIPFPIIKNGDWNTEWFNMDFMTKNLDRDYINKVRERWKSKDGLSKIACIATYYGTFGETDIFKP